MSDCEKCKYLKSEPAGLHKETIQCLNQQIPFETLNRVFANLNEDCPHWYPNAREYTYSEGEWQHRCKRMPTDTMLIWDGAWYLWAGVRDELQIAFCPWCGLELQPMPEVKE